MGDKNMKKWIKEEIEAIEFNREVVIKMLEEELSPQSKKLATGIRDLLSSAKDRILDKKCEEWRRSAIIRAMPLLYIQIDKI